jgi:hypothetical protein
VKMGEYFGGVKCNFPYNENATAFAILKLHLQILSFIMLSFVE